MRKRMSFQRLLCLLLCLCMLCTMFGGCGKKQTGGQVTPAVDDEQVIPDGDEGKKPSGGQEPDIDTKPLPGGFVFTGENQGDSYTDMRLPVGLRGARIAAGGQGGAVSSKQSTLSVPVDATFTLTTMEEVAVDVIEEHLHLLPDTKYAVSKTSATTYEIIPENTLTKGAVYRFVLGDQTNPGGSFVFQTETEFFVMSMFPADKAYGVATNTGIEMSLSEAVATDCDIQKYFTISPAVDGEYERYPNGKTIVFIPKEELAQNTVYTITAKKGLTDISGRSLAADITWEFRTDVDNSYDERAVRCFLENRQMTVTTEAVAELLLSMSYNKEQKPKLDPVQIEIYAYASTEAAISAMKLYEQVKGDYIFTEEEYAYPTEGLTKVDTLTIKVDTPLNYRNVSLPLPKLGEGCYLLNVKMSGECDKVPFSQKEQALLQVTDLNVYTESANGELLIWVNELTSGIASGASYIADCFQRESYWSTEKTEGFTQKTGKTNADGVATISLDEDNAAFLLVSYQGKSCYVCAVGVQKTEEVSYLSYIYNDREVYFSNDTARFYGIVTPKDTNAALPKKLYLELYGAANRTPITVSADGTFEGSIRIEDCSSYHLSYRLYDEQENMICSNYLRITQEEKPIYKMSVSFDKLFYNQNDEMVITIASTFYDGTPVPGLSFELYLSHFHTETGLLTTGQDGTVTCTVKTGNVMTGSTQPVYVYAQATLMGDEETMLSASATTLYFHSQRVFEVTPVYPENSGDVYTEVRINERDTSRLLSAEDLRSPEYPENTIGKPLDEEVSVTLTKYEYRRTQTGTRYAPISKTTRPIYDYDTVETVVKSYRETTRNGVLKLPHMAVEKDFEGYYQYEIEYLDPTTGNRCKAYSYAMLGTQSYYKWKGSDYSVEMTEGTFDLEDEITCQMMFGKDPVTSVPVLYTIYGDKRLSYYVARDGKYQFQFEKEMILGAQVYATMAYAGAVEECNVGNLVYAFERNNALNVTVETDKTSYRPGEEARVTIRVMDLDGRPVGGECILSVVDEACFALSEQFIDELQFFTSQKRYYIHMMRNERFSCLDGDMYYFGGSKNAGIMDNGMLAESDAMRDSVEATAGGGGETASVAVRENFSDNPVFDIIQVDQSGEATTMIKVPDNITEWRLSALAVSNGAKSYDKMALGSGVSDITATLPFFVNAEICNTFLVGDDIVASARIYGSELRKGTTVSYICELYDDKEKLLDTRNAKAVAGDLTWFSFGKLPAGSYSVVVKAITTKASDGVKIPFAVVTSGVMMNVRKDITVDELKTLSPLMYPVRLSFYDDAYDDYIRAVSRLFNGYNTRYDSLAAYYIGAIYSEKLFSNDNGFSAECEEIRRKLSETDGLIPVLEHGEGDLAVSAKIAAVASEALTDRKKAALIEQFNSYLSQGDYANAEALTAALLGLAGLNQPILMDLYYVAEHSEGFSLTAMLYLTAAFAYIGDFDAAGELYDSLAKTYRKNGDGDECFFEGKSTEESIKNTANALFAAALIRKTDAKGLFAYLCSHRSTLTLTCLEECAYVKFFYPVDATSAGFTYQIGEKTETVELEPGRVFSLVLNKSDFNQLLIKKADKEVRVRASYLGSASEAADGEKELTTASIKKSITPYDVSKDIYRVTLTYEITTDKNYVNFTLADFIPSGARYLRNLYEKDYEVSRDWYHGAYVSNNGQYMQGSVYVWNATENKLEGLKPITVKGQVSFLIRGAVEGEFVIDNAVLQDRNTGSFTMSEAGKVLISDSEWKITK